MKTKRRYKCICIAHDYTVEEMSSLSCINGAAQDDRVSLVDVIPTEFLS
jgi:hypothetical protein